MMEILITGNMGYFGPSVVNQLRVSHPDSTLVGFDVRYFGNCISNAHLLPECGVDLQYFADIRKFLEGILKDVDAVVHLAGISNDSIGNRFEKVTLKSNHRASINLAKNAKEAGVKSCIVASSCSMYGAADDQARTERSPLNPLTAYAKSTAFTERDLEPVTMLCLPSLKPLCP